MKTKTRITTPGPWAREYACGCREVLDEGETTGRSDVCPRHGEHTRVVGFLTPEIVAEDLLEAARDARDALRAIRDNGPGLIAQHGDALEALLAAIAKAEGSDR